MKTNIKKNITFRTIKTATPETLFARFLQKQSKTPTLYQLSTWESDGGQYACEQDYVIIHGRLCRTLWEKLSAHTVYLWRTAQINLGLIFNQIKKIKSSAK